jgi:HAD superfamily hydrolase (TIGR01490 family)
MSLAFFDMDGTLVDGDTNEYTLSYFMREGLAPTISFEEVKSFQNMFFEGTLNIEDFIRYAVKPLLKYSKNERDELLYKTIIKTIVPHIFTGAKKALEFHKNRHDTIVIVTSTMDYIVEHVAHTLGIEYYIAAPMAYDENGVLTGDINGIVPYQQNKVVRIKKFIEEHNFSLDDSFGYGDSINDLPMLGLCTHRYAVNANALLKAKINEFGLIEVNFRE